jgi:hypothetical protein
VGHALEGALQESCWNFDFLRGGERYKYEWGARERPTFALALDRPFHRFPREPTFD